MKIKVGFCLLFLFLAAAGLVGIFFPSSKKNFPNPLTSQGEKMFLLKDLLFKADLPFSSGPTLGKDKKSFEVVLKNGTRVVFSSEKDLQRQVSSLQLILKEIKIEKGNLSPMIIDLRAEKAYVSF